MQNDYTELRKELRLLQAVLVRHAPFLASLLRRVRVLAGEDTGNHVSCGVTAQGEVIIFPEAFMALDRPGRVVAWTHEALHVALRHIQRCGDRDPNVWNIASDTADNAIIEAHGYLDRIQAEFYEDLILPRATAAAIGKSENEVAVMRAETIYRLLDPPPSQKSSEGSDDGDGSDRQQDRHGSCGLAEAIEEYRNGNAGSNNQSDSDGSDDSDDASDEPGAVLSPGDSEAYAADTDSPSDGNRYWARVLTEAAQSAKSAGKLPLGVDRIIDELLAPKVSWKRHIKQLLRSGLGNLLIGTWKRPSRRHADLPSPQWLARPTIWILIDTSGSINHQELRQFLSEVSGMTQLSVEKLVIIPWDAYAYEERVIKRPADVAKHLRNMPGGGGTNIMPALTRVAEQMQLLDAVIILTDGWISDIADRETDRILRLVAQKSSTAIFASNASFPKTDRWHQVSLT